MTPSFSLSQNEIKEAIEEYFQKRGFGKIKYVSFQRSEYDRYPGTYDLTASVTLEELKTSS